MGKVAIMSVRATEVALREAGLHEHPVLRSGRTGVAYGSSSGSHEATGEFGRMLNEFTTDGISATTYLKMMSHTAPVQHRRVLRPVRARVHHVQCLHLRQPGRGCGL